MKITLEAKKSVLQKCEVNVKIPDSLADLTRLAKVEVDPVDENQIILVYSVNKNREIKSSYHFFIFIDGFSLQR